MFSSFGAVALYWNSSDYYDLAVWTVTMMSTLCIGIDRGMVIGVVFALLTVNVRLLRAKSAILLPIAVSMVGNRKYLSYLDGRKYRNVSEDDRYRSVIVFRFESPIIFANLTAFKRDLFAKIFQPGGENCIKVKLDIGQNRCAAEYIGEPEIIGKYRLTKPGGCHTASNMERTKIKYKHKKKSTSPTLNVSVNTISNSIASASGSPAMISLSRELCTRDVINISIPLSEPETGRHQSEINVQGSYSTECIKRIVIDMRCVPFIDTSAAILLAHLHEEYKNKSDVTFVLASCTLSVRKTLGSIPASNGGGTFGRKCMYPTIHDAVDVEAFDNY